MERAAFWVLVVGVCVLCVVGICILVTLRQNLEEDEMSRTDVDAQIETGFLGAGLTAEASKGQGVRIGADVNVKPNASAAVSGVAGAAAYSWLSALAGPMTPFLIVGAGLTWLGVRQYKLHKAAKGD